MYCAFSI
jgi:hypothetical protein